MTTRRQFVLHAIPAATLALTTSRAAFAQAAKIEESDPSAVGLGYKHDAAKVDTKKYPGYVAGNNCSNCTLYQGKKTDPWAGCAVLGGRQVNAKGWCQVYAKKA